MKAVIVEIKNGFAAVLSDDGNITRVKDNNYEIGQVITMKKQKVHITKKLAIGAASVAAFFLASGMGVWAYASPYSYVSLDVNPSIEYTVNRFDLVIDVKAVNDDGEEILGQINLNNLNNKTISDAITTTIDQIADNGYFDGTAYEPVTAVSGGAITVDDKDANNNNDITGGIIITTSSEDEKKSEELAQELEETVNEAVDKTGDEVEVEVVSVGYERVQKARELGVTPGKLNLVEKLQASAEDPESIDIEEWLDKPVKDIMKAVKANRKGQAVEETETTETLEQTTTTEKETDTDGTKTEEAKTEEAKKEELTAKEVKEAQKAEVKTRKAEQKATDKAVKAEVKADKAEQKATDKAAKVEVKADKAEQKTTDKAAKVEVKANKAESKSDKATKYNKNSENTDKDNKGTITSNTTTVPVENEKSNNGNRSSEKADNSNKKDTSGNSSDRSNNVQSSKGKK